MSPCAQGVFSSLRSHSSLSCSNVLTSYVSCYAPQFYQVLAQTSLQRAVFHSWKRFNNRNKVENILTFWRLASFSFPFFSSPKLTFGLTAEKPRALQPCLTKTLPCSRKINNKVSRSQQNKIKFLFNYLFCFDVRLGCKKNCYYVIIFYVFFVFFALRLCLFLKTVSMHKWFV